MRSLDGRAVGQEPRALGRRSDRPRPRTRPTRRPATSPRRQPVKQLKILPKPPPNGVSVTEELPLELNQDNYWFKGLIF